MRPFGCGEFIRDYLLGEGPYQSQRIDPGRGVPIEDIKTAYQNALLRGYAEGMVASALRRKRHISLEEALRRTPHRLTRVRSHSFYRYFHLLKQLGWVEATGEEEGSLPGGMPGARVELTPQGTTLVEGTAAQEVLQAHREGQNGLGCLLEGPSAGPLWLLQGVS